MGKDKKAQPNRVDPRWKPLEEGVFKINLNADYDQVNNEGTTGCIIRDFHGKMINLKHCGMIMGRRPLSWRRRLSEMVSGLQLTWVYNM
jgi:hypothetical protein